MKLALFDLDHALLPFDSGMAWTRFLVGERAMPAQAEADYLDHCRQYVAGTLDIHAMHRACVAPLRKIKASQLAAWLAAFERQLAPRVPASSLALVRQHQDAGHRCVLVTATTRFLAEPCARLFGIEQVLATEAVRDDGGLTGEILGLPCYREHKLTRVLQWLAGRTPPVVGLRTFEASWFYSDSASDLALLQAVSHPVAVNPDARLRAHAQAAGWPLLELLN
jgi:HAD superfamily hydrolase (TIGR01490 family)